MINDSDTVFVTMGELRDWLAKRWASEDIMRERSIRLAEISVIAKRLGDQTKEQQSIIKEQAERIELLQYALEAERANRPKKLPRTLERVGLVGLGAFVGWKTNQILR